MVVVVGVVDGGEDGERIKQGKPMDEEWGSGEEAKRRMGSRSSKAAHS